MSILPESFITTTDPGTSDREKETGAVDMRKKVLVLSLAAGCVCGLLTGCGGKKKNVSYKDGVYTARSEVREEVEGESEDDEGAGYGEVTLTITDGKISDAEFITYEVDGTVKDENYGKKQGSVANRDFYNKAQKAVQAAPKYAEKLVESGSLDDIDAISGATINYEEFQEAVTKALEKAETDDTSSENN